MVSLLNGFSQMGKSISTFAHEAGLLEQKSQLEKEQLILANQLQEGTQTRLAVIEGDQSRQTAVTTAEAQGNQQRTTAQFTNELPETADEKAKNEIGLINANAARVTADRPIASNSLAGGFLVRDTKTGKWELNGGAAAGAQIEIDKTSNNLSAQTGLSDTAIKLMTGQTKGMRLNAAQTKAAQNEITNWGVANGVNTSTLTPQVEGQFKVLERNIARNNQAIILEQELMASIETAKPAIEALNNGKLKVGNLVALWAGKETNDPVAMTVRDQLSRLREELAGYNAVASGHLNDNGSPAPTPANFHEAEKTISDGISTGSLEALGKSVTASAEKNKVILQNAIDQANKDFFALFNATYRPPVRTPAPDHDDKDKPSPDATPTLPPGVPSGSQYSPSRKQWRSPDGKIYDESGKEVIDGPR